MIRFSPFSYLAKVSKGRMNINANLSRATRVNPKHPLHFTGCNSTLLEKMKACRSSMNQTYPKIFLKPGREASLLRGHPWLFSGAVSSVEGRPEPGDVVVAATHKGSPIAAGFYNPLCDIVFRLLTTDMDQTIDEGFWFRKIRAAIELRKKIIPRDTTACRLINAEGDGMPGLIVDRYGHYLVFSIATAGMEKIRPTVVDILLHEMESEGIYERSEGRARQLEGLEDRIGCTHGTVPGTVEITENALRFKVDMIAGQKTGFFLDQRPNREIAGKLSDQAMVLNCFSYTGAFSVYCARGGAKCVVSVESSEPSNETARWNLESNGFSLHKHPVVRADVFKFLRETDERFDVIILDPPAFAKSKKDVAKAARGYRDINLQAIGRLMEGGILATFSCSNYIDEDLFGKILAGAVRDAGKTARLLQTLGPGPDHPTSLAHPEGRYLKGRLLHLFH
jgi:23S rRNA (cytosine1962-C5)-methyltransferase